MALALTSIAQHLESLEETIIYKLLDRGQYKANRCVYEQGKSGFDEHANKSLFDVRLLYQEKIESQFGRFSVPEERPFNADLPSPQRKFEYDFPELHIEDFNVVNLSEQIKNDYLEMIPQLCEEGEDGHFGSTVQCDVYALHAIAARVHYGAFYVAESKFQGNESLYRQLIEAGDKDALLQTLTRPEVEANILVRVRSKVDHIQAAVDKRLRHLIDPEVVMNYYEQSLIPLTKQGQILYLLHRSL